MIAHFIQMNHNDITTSDFCYLTDKANMPHVSPHAAIVLLKREQSHVSRDETTDCDCNPASSQENNKINV